MHLMLIHLPNNSPAPPPESYESALAVDEWVTGSAENKEDLCID